MKNPPAPIANIWAVGRNYADHAKELGNQVPSTQSEPMIFLKAGSCIVKAGETFSLPTFSNDVHYEVEVALRFGQNLEFSELTIALDLTARDWQTRLKEKGHPWAMAKSFQSSCPIGPLRTLVPGLDIKNLRFSLHVNGELRQQGSTADMIHGAEALRTYVLERFPVVPGDLLLTGTPAGVGPLHPGDHLEAEISGILNTTWHVAAKE